MRRGRARLGAYGHLREDDGIAAFPLRLTAPADVPAKVEQARAATAAAMAPVVPTPVVAAIGAAMPGAAAAAPADAEVDAMQGPDEWGAAWAVVPVELLDLGGFDDAGRCVGPCLDDSPRTTFGRPADEGTRGGSPKGGAR